MSLSEIWKIQVFKISKSQKSVSPKMNCSIPFLYSPPPKFIHFRQTLFSSKFCISLLGGSGEGRGGGEEGEILDQHKADRESFPVFPRSRRITFYTLIVQFRRRKQFSILILAMCSQNDSQIGPKFDPKSLRSALNENV